MRHRSKSAGGIRPAPKQPRRYSGKTVFYGVYSGSRESSPYFGGLIDLSQGYTQKIFSAQTGEGIHDAELAEDFEGIVFDHIKENIKY